MDILFEIVNSNEKELMHLIQAVEKSNINKKLQDKIMDVLYTVIEQTRQAKSYGWL